MRLPDFKRMAHEGSKVSPTYLPPLPPGNIPGTHFCWKLSQSQGHSAAGRIMSMKNSNDTIRNRTRDLPICSAVSQPTASPRTPNLYTIHVIMAKLMRTSPSSPYSLTNMSGLRDKTLPLPTNNITCLNTFLGLINAEQ